MLSPDVEFYKNLAEARREALDESLNQNEELWVENEELKERVASLEETVEKARKITEMIEPYLNDDSNEDANKRTESVESTETSKNTELPKEKLSDYSGNSENPDSPEAETKEQYVEPTVKQNEDN